MHDRSRFLRWIRRDYGGVQVSERQQYIKSSRAMDQLDTATALFMIADTLDMADDQKNMWVNPIHALNNDYMKMAYAWMWAAYLIADTCEMDSVTLRALANKIFKGVQGVL